jgi:GNAT superfamily N-acetyltransferase
VIGRRAVVRYRLHDGEYGATDVVGVVESWNEHTITLRTRAGDVVDVAVSDVLVVKTVPPRTVTRRDVRDLEAAAAAGWQPLERATLGGWVLRAAGGYTRRANSCLPLAEADRPVDQAIEAVEQWYADRDLVPTFQVPAPLGTALHRALDLRGWSPSEDPTVVMTADVGAVGAAVRPGLPEVRVDDEPDGAWLAGYHHRGAELPADAIRVLRNADLVGFANVDEGGRRVAIARGAVSTAPSGRRWLGVTAVEVVPDARRRGLGSHIVGGLAAWAARLGATDTYLQAMTDNTAALATYERLGFIEHHRYHYRRLR